MSTESTQSIIDHLVERYGLTSAGARAQCLQWVSLSDEEVWSAGDWWFKRGRAEIAIVGGTKVYALPALSERIHALEWSDGRYLTELHPSDFRAHVGNDASGGLPTLWCRLEASSSAYARVELWPTPVAAGTVHALYDRVRRVLTDSASSPGNIPADYRHLVLLRAEVYASLHLGQAGQSEQFLQAYRDGLAALGGAGVRQPLRDNEIR